MLLFYALPTIFSVVLLSRAIVSFIVTCYWGPSFVPEDIYYL
jgi:hypothetical protein